MTSEAKTLLVVDDDPAVREGLEELFRLQGYQVLTAVDGEAGLRAVQAERPDLMILDVGASSPSSRQSGSSWRRPEEQGYRPDAPRACICSCALSRANPQLPFILRCGMGLGTAIAYRFRGDHPFAREVGVGQVLCLVRGGCHATDLCLVWDGPGCGEPLEGSGGGEHSSRSSDVRYKHRKALGQFGGCLDHLSELCR